MSVIKIDKNKYNEMEYDSRKIKEGDIFVALEGAVVDGHNYIDTAIEKGAKCILISREVEKREGIEYIFVPELRKNLGLIASEYYSYPQKQLKIIGITGTNGKTTTTYLIEQLLGAEKVARIGTIEYKIGDEIIEAANTTPESLDIVKICKKAVAKNLEYLVMEVSSHALSLGRVDMLEFDVGIFTNLTQDHLDFHKTMEEYFEAKGKLFEKVKDKNSCIINIDDSYGQKYFEKFGGVSYGIGDGELSGNYINNNHFEIEVKYGKLVGKTKFGIVGKYNLYNTLGAIGAALKVGYNFDEILKKVATLKGAPGRFETVDCGQNFLAVVDYAHTDDALLNLLKTVRELEKNRTITVFGCGGDRDKTKRPKMLKVAVENSDVVIVTADNPRTETIENIIADMLEGKKTSENLLVEYDREQAIIKAVALAKENDVIVVAGKGHETYQILGRDKYHFDDREYLMREITKRKLGK